jgi:hypothetical protein
MHGVSPVRETAVANGAEGRASFGPRPSIDHLLIAILALPNLVWVLLIRGLWVSDASLYGLQALRLHHAMSLGMSAWWRELLAVDPKPPILPWLGQFLVPLGTWLGSVDAALLLVPFAAQCATLYLTYYVARALFPDRGLAMMSALAVACSPLFITISKQFYVQSLQASVVMWFVYIMLRSVRWSRALVAANLLAAGSLAALTMMSTPLFCVVPGLAAAAGLWTKEHARPRQLVAVVAVFVPGLVMAALAILWYGEHLTSALAYARFGFHDAYAGVRGVSYVGRLGIWILQLWLGMFWAPIAAVVLALSAGTVVVRGRSFFTAPAALLLATGLQVAMVLCVLATSDQQEYRYVLPLIGYASLLLCWVLARLGKHRVTLTIGVVLLLQWAGINLWAFGVIPSGVLWSQPPTMPDERRYALMTRIAALEDDRAERILLVTGGLEFYNLQVEYYSAQRPGYFDKRHLSYQSAEFLLVREDVNGDPDRAWVQIERWSPDHVVLVSGDIRREQLARWEHDPRGWGTVMLEAVDLSRRIESSSQYERLPTPGFPELEIYRAVRGR